MRNLFILLALFHCISTSAATLSYQKISTDTFKFVLKNDEPMEIEQAQSSIYPSAAEICGDKKPSFGKYSFDSTEPISKAAATSSFTFQQEIICTDEAVVETTPEKINLSPDQEKTIKAIVKKRTEKFLSDKESGNFKAAYGTLDPSMKDVIEFSEWKRQEADYIEENLGKLISRDFWRITLYNNPPNSPKPGLYVAVDYENSHEKSPINCGYVMWYLPAVKSRDFSVMREEYGNINSEILKKIPKENLQSVRKQIGCRAS